MKKELLLYAFMLISPFVLSAQDWLDVTNIYVENPHFDNGSTTGWQWNSNAGSQKTGHGGMEFWNGWFDFNQTLQVPNGKYAMANYLSSVWVNGSEPDELYFFFDSIRNVISDLRNKAAHGEQTDAKDAFGCLKLILGQNYYILQSGSGEADTTIEGYGLLYKLLCWTNPTKEYAQSQKSSSENQKKGKGKKSFEI